MAGEDQVIFRNKGTMDFIGGEIVLVTGREVTSRKTT
jgi:hypothetical protein